MIETKFFYIPYMHKILLGDNIEREENLRIFLKIPGKSGIEILLSNFKS